MSVVRVTMDVETIFEVEGVPEVVRIVEAQVAHLFGGELSHARLVKVEEVEGPYHVLATTER